MRQYHLNNVSRDILYGNMSEIGVRIIEKLEEVYSYDSYVGSIHNPQYKTPGFIHMMMRRSHVPRRPMAIKESVGTVMDDDGLEVKGHVYFLSVNDITPIIRADDFRLMSAYMQGYIHLIPKTRNFNILVVDPDQCFLTASEQAKERSLEEAFYDGDGS